MHPPESMYDLLTFRKKIMFGKNSNWYFERYEFFFQILLNSNQNFFLKIDLLFISIFKYLNFQMEPD